MRTSSLKSPSNRYSAPSFAEGALVALLLSVLGAVAYISLTLVIVPAVVAVLIAVALNGGYMFYLIKRSAPKSGKLFGSLVILSVLGMCVLVPMSIVLVVAILVLSIWLIRSTYYRLGLVDSVFDFGLNLLSLGAAIAAIVVSDSYFLAFWTFFVTQALHVYLPCFQKKAIHGSSASDQFRNAFENGEAALNRMYKTAP